MTTEQLLSNSIVPLRTSDTGEDAIEMMNEFYIRHLPIVNNKQLLGLISEDDILNFDVEEPIGSYSLSLSRPYVNNKDHIFEVMRLMAELQLTVIPVVNDEGDYVGLVTLEDVLQYFAKTASFSEPGSVIVLEMSRRDYSLAEIARIVESESALILSLFITSHIDTTRIDVTVKINRQNVGAIIATFDRFDYQVKATFNEAEYVDSLKERYDALMSFLKV